MIFSLGNFKFEDFVLTDNIRRNTSYNIASQERMGSYEAFFASKKESQELTIACRTLPFKGAKNNALDELYGLAATQKSHSLVNGAGKYYGRFVIMSIEETVELFLDNGSFLSQAFTLTLKRDFSDEFLWY